MTVVHTQIQDAAKFQQSNSQAQSSEKLGLVGVYCIYIYLLDSIEGFESMNKLLSYFQ